MYDYVFYIDNLFIIYMLKYIATREFLFFSFVACTYSRHLILNLGNVAGND